MGKQRLESIRDDFGDDLIDNIANRNGSKFGWIFSCFLFGDES
jgi:hypothetical protein